MVGSTKLIENIAGATMLGSFAMYGNNRTCCNSGKKGINEAETQYMTETQSGNLIISDDNKNKASEVREKIVNKYIYKDRPVEKVVYKDKIIEKKIPLSGSVYFPSADYTIFNGNLLTAFTQLIEEVTGCNTFSKNTLRSIEDLSNLYKEHKNEFNPNIDFAKLYQYIDIIKQSEADMYIDFKNKFESIVERNNNEGILRSFLAEINNIIYYILMCTYEKSLMNLFNYYEYIDQATQAPIGNKKRNINTCVRIKERMNKIYEQWKNLDFFNDIERFNIECNHVLDLNKVIFDFLSKKEENNKKVEFSINGLSEMLKLESYDKTENVDKLGKKTISLKHLLRYCTMQILVDFVIGVNEKILDKFSFLSDNSGNNDTLNLKLHANSTLKDIFYVNNNEKRNKTTIYVLIDKIISEDFNILKRIYDDLCSVKNDMFGNYVGNGVAITGELSGDRYDISSLCKLYDTITSFKGELCEYFKDIFNLGINGYNDSSSRSQVTIAMNRLLNTSIAPGSFLATNNIVVIKRIGNYCFK